MHERGEDLRGAKFSFMEANEDHIGVGSRRNLRRLHTINPHIPTQQDHHVFSKVRERNQASLFALALI